MHACMMPAFHAHDDQAAGNPEAAADAYQRAYAALAACYGRADVRALKMVAAAGANKRAAATCADADTFYSSAGTRTVRLSRHVATWSIKRFRFHFDGTFLPLALLHSSLISSVCIEGHYFVMNSASRVSHCIAA